eukprot:UN03638
MKMTILMIKSIIKKNKIILTIIIKMTMIISIIIIKNNNKQQHVVNIHVLIHLQIYHNVFGAVNHLLRQSKVNLMIDNNNNNNNQNNNQNNQNNNHTNIIDSLPHDLIQYTIQNNGTIDDLFKPLIFPPSTITRPLGAVAVSDKLYDPYHAHALRIEEGIVTYKNKIEKEKNKIIKIMMIIILAFIIILKLKLLIMHLLFIHKFMQHLY